MNTVHLLHIEDDIDFQTMVSKVLSPKNQQRVFLIVQAESEEQALEIFERDRPDLVLVDYQLRTGNGLSCIERVRKIDPGVPLVAISGQATNEVATELLVAGADEYLDKRDLRPHRLREAVDSALRLGEVRRNLQGKTESARSEPLETAMCDLLTRYLHTVDENLLELLDNAEAAIVEAGLSMTTFRKVWHQLSCECSGNSPDIRAARELMLRPMYLELKRRLEFSLQQRGLPL